MTDQLDGITKDAGDGDGTYQDDGWELVEEVNVAAWWSRKRIS